MFVWRPAERRYDEIAMKEIILIEKPAGMTPLEAIRRYKKRHPETSDVPMTYAGRLDPMAEGLLLVLSGNAIGKKKKYMDLDKEYVAEFVFGISSDTCDALGIVRESQNPLPEKSSVLDALRALEGTRRIPLPPYSSYRVDGKPLFFWARERKLNLIAIPKKEMTVYGISSIRIGSVSGSVLKNRARKRIARISGDFRQGAALKSWGNLKKRKFVSARATIRCSSGTYVRSLANIVGKKTKTGAILFSLKRTKIGKFML